MVSQMMSADSNPLMITIEAHKLDISEKEKAYPNLTRVHAVTASKEREDRL